MIRYLIARLIRWAMPDVLADAHAEIAVLRGQIAALMRNDRALAQSLNEHRDCAIQQTRLIMEARGAIHRLEAMPMDASLGRRVAALELRVMPAIDDDARDMVVQAELVRAIGRARDGGES